MQPLPSPPPVPLSPDEAARLSGGLTRVPHGHGIAAIAPGTVCKWPGPVGLPRVRPRPGVRLSPH